MNMHVLAFFFFFFFFLIFFTKKSGKLAFVTWFRRLGRVCIPLVVPDLGVLINSGWRSTRTKQQVHKARDGRLLSKKWWCMCFDNIVTWVFIHSYTSV
ncbi:hypothetical protein LZ32DRAFT_267569 [Colletotrichum eremochloae]|nr:hypothetical protein LZ32DRAFT_267569 [Colletotrichum eremochloae]